MTQPNLDFVGPNPTTGADVVNKLDATTIIGGITPNTETVNTDIATAVTSTYVPYATVSELTTTYSPVPYYQAQDLLNLPLTAVGTVGTTPAQLGITGYYGAASLDSSGHVPAAQFPALGNGYILGPYGPTVTTSGSTNTTPLKIADFEIGAATISFRPFVYMTVLVTGVMAHPIIEVRIANTETTAPTSYASAGTLIARGAARSLYSGLAPIAVNPIPDTTGETPSLFPPTYQVWITAWLFDAASYNNVVGVNSVTLQSGGIASAAAYLLRGST
jgi:hypothetical protein